MFKTTALLALTGAVAAAPMRESVPGEYIVVMNPNAPAARRTVQMEEVARSVGARMANHYEVEGKFAAYHMTGVNSAEAALRLQDAADVAYVQPNYIDHISDDCVETSAQPWGIRRTVHDGPANSIGNTYKFDPNKCGEGIDLYILDTGIRQTHEDFTGRARWVGDYAGDGETDGNGHGTHVASTAGGSIYGLARCAQVSALKVCNNRGQCPTNAQLGALTKLANDARTGKKIVANMSLGGRGTNTASLNAVRVAKESGAIVVVAAGNSNDNSCGYSPAQSEHAITVMSSDSTDRRSSFSNYGRCSQLYAPGSSILAAWPNSDTATNNISGTSMASPHVAGVVAMIWSEFPSFTPDMVEAELMRRTTGGRITNPGNGSPNQLLQNLC